MTYRAIRRILQGGAVAAVLALAGSTAPVGVMAQEPVPDPAPQEPIENPQAQQDPVGPQPYENDMGDEGMSWGWLGLLGLAGLLGLRRRDPREVRVGTTTTRP